MHRTHGSAAEGFGRWADQLAADIYISAAVREQRRRMRRPDIGSFDSWTP
jgi:hypothetical protein